jgi:cytohesin
MQIQTTAHFEIAMSDSQQSLLEAAAQGNIAVLETSIADGKKISKIADAQGFTALHLAARNGHKDTVAFLLKCGLPIEARSKDGFTPLHVAANSGHLELVKYLVKNGAHLNSKSDNGLTPLHMATSGDHAAIVEYFILQGAPINEKDSFGFTPLHISAYYGIEKTTDVLLEYGADCTVRNIKGETPAKVAINNDQHRVAGLFMRKQIEQISTQQSSLLKATERFKQRKKVTVGYDETAVVEH